MAKALRSEKKMRRYEMFLPLEFNDYSPVPRKLFSQTSEELRIKFNGSSSTPVPVEGGEGSWQDEDEIFYNKWVKICVDVKDNDANRDFFSNYKAELERRFRQKVIYMTSYPIEIIESPPQPPSELTRKPEKRRS